MVKLLKVARCPGIGLRPDEDASVRFDVCEASIITGYFEKSKRPMLCVERENKIIPPTDRLDESPPPSKKYELESHWVYAGIIVGSDEELTVLRREGGYAIRDLRNVRVADLFADWAGRR